MARAGATTMEMPWGMSTPSSCHLLLAFRESSRSMQDRDTESVAVSATRCDWGKPFLSIDAWIA
jgi:hypothetical protein